MVLGSLVRFIHVSSRRRDLLQPVRVGLLLTRVCLCGTLLLWWRVLPSLWPELPCLGPRRSLWASRQLWTRRALRVQVRFWRWLLGTSDESRVWGRIPRWRCPRRWISWRGRISRRRRAPLARGGF